MYSIFANADLVPQFCVALIDICISSYQSVLWVMVHELVYDKDLPLNSQNLIICELTKGQSIYMDAHALQWRPIIYNIVQIAESFQTSNN